MRRKPLTEQQRQRRNDYAYEYQRKNAEKIKKRRQEKVRLDNLRRKADRESRQIEAVIPEIDPRFQNFYSPCVGCKKCNSDNTNAISCGKLSAWVIGNAN